MRPIRTHNTLHIVVCIAKQAVADRQNGGNSSRELYVASAIAMGGARPQEYEAAEETAIGMGIVELNDGKFEPTALGIEKVAEMEAAAEEERKDEAEFDLGLPGSFDIGLPDDFDSGLN